ncbi:MAG: hypothetical protein ACN6ON_02955 [Sphingobacterium sp.]
MRGIIFLVFLCCIFSYSCQKDNADAYDKRLLSITRVARVADFRPLETNYMFEYDAQGRIIKVNDQLYHYGKNGKVDYSRIDIRSQNNGVIREKIIRLSYHWDEQNRLKNILVDSLYHKLFYISEGINVIHKESIVKNVLLSSFFYSSGAVAPTKITYREWNESDGKIGMDEEVTYILEGENIAKSKLYKHLMRPLPNNNGDLSYSGSNFYSFYRYSNSLNPFYSIYKQMGFNPISIHKVVSKNLENAFFAAVFEEKEIGNVRADWSKKTDVQITLGPEGRPRTMSYVVKRDISDVKDFIPSEVLLNYVYE